MKLGLDNITEFMESIGNPQHSFKAVHVGGTNGKGSVCAMLAQILQQTGYKTGLFTSPHLVDFRERIQVNSRLIPKQSVVKFITSYCREIERRQLTFFEVLTALAFCHFKHVGVDVAIVEVGLGGRLDASNVLNPLLTMTTDISYDHMDILGNSLGQIAGEKAGIIKPNVPHLIGLLPHEALKVIQKQCRVYASQLIQLMPDAIHRETTNTRFDLNQNGFVIKNLTPGLLGIHQHQNTALAAMAAALLNEQGLRISKKHIRQGVHEVSWPARFQVVRKRGQPIHIFEVCHNVSGIKTFVDTCHDMFPKQKVHIIAGFVENKEHQLMVDYLTNIAASVRVVPLKTHRTVKPAAFIKSINWHNVPVVAEKSLAIAYRNLLKRSTITDIIAVIGSHYLVGEFFEKYGWPK